MKLFVTLLASCTILVWTAMALAGPRKIPLDLASPLLRNLHELNSKVTADSATWIYRRPDQAVLSVTIQNYPSVKAATAGANPHGVTQSAFPPPTVKISPYTKRRIGDSYWTDGGEPGDFTVVVRAGSDVYRAWISHLGQARTGFAVRKPITAKDREAVEDLTIEAMRAWRSRNKPA